MWMRVGSAAACFAAIMGFSRLAYGVLVPSMRGSLGGTFVLYGAIGAANMVGYLIGTILTTRLARRPDRSRINVLALLGMCAAMAACALVREPIALAVLRFLVGAASGVALSLTLSLAVEHVPPARRGLAAGIVWGGGSAGIALIGSAARVVASASADAWRAEWLAMAAAGVAATLLFARLTHAVSAGREHRDVSGAIGIFARARYRALSIAYFLFGVGYIDVVTFFGSALARAHGPSSGAAWTILGMSGIAGIAIWGPVVDRFRSGVPVVFACVCCAAGAALVTLGTPIGAYAGAVGIGISFIGIPAMVGALLQQREPADRYPRAFASMTVALGIGQILGPLLGGFVADRAGPFAAIATGAAALAIAAVSALCYRRPAEIAYSSVTGPREPEPADPESLVRRRRRTTPSAA